MLFTFTREAVMSYAANAEIPRQPGWDGRHYNSGFPRFHPGLIVVMVLGFIFWWPVGLAVLGFILWRKSMGCWSHGGAERWQHKMERMRSRMEGGSWGYHSSSGNHAFDEYRTETLRRLEDEQREFREFLERLRFAKDKTEFDQFMAERRNRPPAAPSESPQPQA
jgi:hypothetical protein